MSDSKYRCSKCRCYSYSQHDCCGEPMVFEPDPLEARVQQLEAALAEAQAEVEMLRLENTHLDQSLSPANQAALDAMLASPPACEGERVDVLKVTYPKGLYRVMGYAFQDGDTVTIEAAQLPGCITQGNTLAEAIEHFKEAVQACIETYLAHGEPIPWQDVERPEISRRVTVFVQAEPAAAKPAVQDEQLTPANEKFLDEMLASKPAAGGESQDITDQNSLLGALAAANQRADEAERERDEGKRLLERCLPQNGIYLHPRLYEEICSFLTPKESGDEVPVPRGQCDNGQPVPDELLRSVPTEGPMPDSPELLVRDSSSESRQALGDCADGPAVHGSRQEEVSSPGVSVAQALPADDAEAIACLIDRTGEWPDARLAVVHVRKRLADQSAELSRLQEVEKAYLEDQDRQYREIENITPSHEELLRFAEESERRRKERRDEAHELYGHMTVPELQEYYKKCSWDEEGAVTIVHDEKALAQSAELDALRSKIKGLGQGFEAIRDCEKNECVGCQHVATTYAAIAAKDDKP